MIKTFPSILPDSASVELEANNSTFVDELTRSMQTRSLVGDRWRIAHDYANRFGDDAKILRAFLTSLGGQRGRFYLGPPDLDKQGTAGTTGIVSGAGQTGSTLNTTGWATNQPQLFAIGDYFGVNGELKLITAQISSDASGNATLEFAPPLRKSPANSAPIEVNDPRAVFYLENDRQASWRVTSPIIYALSLSMVEDVT